MISLIKSRRNQFLVVVVITFLIYVNTLQNGFVLDDNDFIAGWQEIRSLQNTSRFFEGVIPSGHEGIYRPLKTLYLALSYKLWGLNPLGYHLQALLVHLISTGLVYLIAFQLTRKGSLAFLTSLLFGTHPIHTEAISFITASSDTLGIMFFFLSFYLYLLWESKKDGRMWCIIFSVISALVAFFTYEITITLPLMILFYDVCFKKLQKKGLSTKLKVYSVYFAGVISYLFVRIIILGIVARGNYLGNSFYLTMLVMTKVILKYIQVLILPINLNVKHLISEGIWSYKLEVADKTVLNQSIIDPVVLAAVAVMVVLVLIAIRSFRTHPMLTFSIGWFFLGLAPALNIIPSYMLMAERYLYLSSFGFCLLFAVLIHDFYTNGYGPKSYKKIAVTLIFIFVIASFCALTISRNREWKDDITINP